MENSAQPIKVIVILPSPLPEAAGVRLPRQGMPQGINACFIDLQAIRCPCLELRETSYSIPLYSDAMGLEVF